MSQIMHFCRVKLLAWKSGGVKFLTNIMSALRHFFLPQCIDCERKMKKWQQCVLIWQNICLFWMIMKTWSGIEPCVLFWMQHWLVHWWHVKRRYSENYSLPSRERSTACTLLNCFQPHRNHPFHLKAWILWALNRRGLNEYRLEVVWLMWQMCETDVLHFDRFLLLIMMMVMIMKSII